MGTETDPRPERHTLVHPERTKPSGEAAGLSGAPGSLRSAAPGTGRMRPH